MGIDDAVKALFADELQTIKDAHDKTEERSVSNETKLQEHAAKLEERAQEAQQLRDALTEKQQAIEALEVRIKTLEDLDVLGLKEKIGRLEDDQEGDGGLKQCREKIAGFDAPMKEMERSAKESADIAHHTKTRTDEFDLVLRDFARKCSDTESAMKVFEGRIAKAEALSSRVEDRQEKVEDIEARLEDTLRKEVLKQLKDVREQNQVTLQATLESKSSSTRNEVNTLITYALQTLAASHTERKKMVMAKDVVMIWRETVRVSERSRLGAYAIRNIFHKAQRGVFNRWTRRAAFESLSWRLRREYAAKIPDVLQVLEDSGLEQRCNKIDEDLRILQQDKCPHEKVDTAVKEQKSELNARLQVLEKIHAEIAELQTKLTNAEVVSKKHETRFSDMERLVEEAKKAIASIDESTVQFANHQEVQSMMRDILLIWNSIKQLDSAKADKKDVDAIAIEGSNRDRLSARRMEDMEVESSQRLKEESDRTHDKWSEFTGRFEESSKQFRHWEQMWEKLASFVEDLVAKIAEMQGCEPGRIGASTASLKSGGPSSRRLGFEGNSADAARNRHDGLPNTDSMEAKMLWMNSAKGMVDNTIEQSMVHVHPMRPRAAPRPKSASLPRRSIDRGR